MAIGPSGFLNVQLSPQQAIMWDVRPRIYGWSEEVAQRNLGPKFFHGALATPHIVDRHQLCTQIFHTLTGQLMGTMGAPAWRLVTGETQVGEETSYLNFGQDYLHHDTALGKVYQGVVFLEFVISTYGANTVIG
jgi:hypothetical protein